MLGLENKLVARRSIHEKGDHTHQKREFVQRAVHMCYFIALIHILTPVVIIYMILFTKKSVQNSSSKGNIYL